VLASGEVKACLLMTSCHNPLGVTMPSEKKQELVRIIERHQTPLVENDAYGELLSPDECQSAKSFDTSGLVLRCSSFSNCLSPELRVGWVTAGRFRDRMLSVKFLSSMASQWIAQDTVAEFLKHGNFNRHLRSLRSALQERMAVGVAELTQWRRLIVRQFATLQRLHDLAGTRGRDRFDEDLRCCHAAWIEFCPWCVVLSRSPPRE
jgi:DNA-binding transcriptional MocR family regulator